MLLRRVARERESRLLAIRSAAEEQAHAIVVRARQEARARLQQAVAEERRQFERAVGDKRAALDTVAVLTTPGPAVSEASLTSAPISSPSRFAAGATEYLASGAPFGRPR